MTEHLLQGLYGVDTLVCTEVGGRHSVRRCMISIVNK